jgi:peptidoglycan/xylan/chitin deacetylase (PgdA/CDA1 family)
LITPVSRTRFVAWLLAGVFLAIVPLAVTAPPPQQSPGRVYVILWFDTEDYILPQSDDAAKRLAAFLTQQGIQATFKMVGEKARVLERRGRRDVIGALAQHEIGYHTDTHSQHPTPAEYESTLDWQTGVDEFTRRERAGFDDVRRIFGQVPTCYGQPGSSWAPQAYAALKKWGVKVYLDEGEQVGLNGKPFWYGGLLNIFNTSEGRKLQPDEQWSNLADAKARFQESYLRLTSQREGGIVSLYFHPCQFVHREFWDEVNFAHGANPPPEEWKLPAIKTPEESEKAFKYFEDLITYMKSFPRVEFMTASQALKLFKDPAQKRVFSAEDLAAVARQVDAEVSFQVHDDYTLAASEVFLLLNKYVASVVRKAGAPSLLLDGTPYGPAAPVDVAPGFPTGPGQVSPPQENAGLNADATPPQENGGLKAAATEVPWSQFSRTVLDVADFLQKNNQIPNAVWLGSRPVSPESYLVALAQVTTRLLVKAEPPESVTLAPARLAAEKYVAEDSPALWGWVIFRPDFRAPKLMGLAKLQAWTLKPARPQASR